MATTLHEISQISSNSMQWNLKVTVVRMWKIPDPFKPDIPYFIELTLQDLFIYKRRSKSMILCQVSPRNINTCHVLRQNSNKFGDSKKIEIEKNLQNFKELSNSVIHIMESHVFRHTFF